MPIIKSIAEVKKELAKKALRKPTLEEARRVLATKLPKKGSASKRKFKVELSWEELWMVKLGLDWIVGPEADRLAGRVKQLLDS